MAKFQSLSDFQALPENQMKKTVGGLNFSFFYEMSQHITGGGETVDHFVYKCDYQTTDSETCVPFTWLFR
jgi:hypothetical protein